MTLEQTHEETNKVAIAKLTATLEQTHEETRFYQSECWSWPVEGSVGSCDWFCLDEPPLSHTVTQQYQHQPRQPGEGRGRGGGGGRRGGVEEGRRGEREEGRKGEGERRKGGRGEGREWRGRVKCCQVVGSCNLIVTG